MERPGLESGRGKRPSTWLRDVKKQHHAEYLRRLAELRDDLIGQEKSNLAHALERLRLSSITNSDSVYRLRLRDGRSFPQPRRQMLTTSERFRLMRPVKPPPTLFPLQGKQILEPKDNRANRTEEKMTIPEAAVINNTVQTNLQRLTQPVPSIPSLERKTAKRTDLLLNNKTTNKRKSRTVQQTYFNALSQNFSSSSKTSDVTNLRPEAFRLDSLTSGDRLEEDKLRKFYCVYYIPPTISSQRSMNKTFPRTFKKQPTSCRRLGTDRSLTTLELTKTRIDCPRERYRLPVVPAIQRNPTSVISFSFNDQPVNEIENVSEREETTSGGRLSKKHIRVDMPTIICNCPTPDCREREDAAVDAVSLSKMYKQSEIRQRELRNLFEDVRELNMRTDTLTQLEQIYVEND